MTSAPPDIKLRYQSRVVPLTAKALKYLTQMEHYRSLRRGHVEFLLSVLKRGESFPTPIVLNVMKQEGIERWRIIDGNHRHAALVQFFRLYPAARVELLVTRWDNLGRSEEEAVFRAANGGLRMTIADWVSKNQDRITILRLIRAKFPTPVHIYPPKPRQIGFHFTPFVRAYMDRESASFKMLKIADSIDQIEAMGQEDYEALHRFAEDYLIAFGEPSRGTPWVRAVSLEALMKTYFWNISVSPRSEVIAGWVAASADGAVLDMAREGSFTFTPRLVERITFAMNRTRKRTNKFLDSTGFKEWHESQTQIGKPVEPEKPIQTWRQARGRQRARHPK